MKSARTPTIPLALLALLSMQLGACTRAVFLDDEAADAGTGMQLNDEAGGAPAPGGAAGSTAAPGPAIDPSTSAPKEGPSAGDAAAGPESVSNMITGNPPGCPSGPPVHESACDENSAGDVCAYSYDDPVTPTQSLYSECSCRVGCDAELTTRWDCYENVTSGLMRCPPEQPEDGSSCSGFKGYECRYPVLTSCTCPTDPSNNDWECETTSGARETEPFPPIADDSVLVRDISDEDAQALCAWLTFRGDGFPEPPVLPPDSSGYYPSSGCRGSHYFDCHIFWPDEVPAAACVDNLEISTCEATLAVLRDCMLSMLAGVQVGLGCGPYIATPGCPGTIAIPNESGSPGDLSSCHWRVN